MPDQEELRALAIAHGVDPTYLDAPDAVCACGHRRDDHGDGVVHTSCCADFVCECVVFAPGAVLSACGRYRYELRRVWDPTGPLLEFVMLNPSTADASVDDPTIRRCVGFAKAWGYGGIVVRNLFALRATNPEVLLNYSGDAYGPRNDEFIGNHVAHCTVVAWGANAATLDARSVAVIKALAMCRPRLFCLGTNANGSPKHPLYVRADRTPIRWEMSGRPRLWWSARWCGRW